MRPMLLMLALAAAAGARLAWVAHQAPAEMMMVIVYSDNTVKYGAVPVERCVAVSEMAMDGKVLKIGSLEDDEPFAIAMTCGPEALIRTAFSRRMTP